MNILPKKSWHVRTKKNIERVRRDEAQAAEEAKEIERRKALAESEARTEILRNRARKRKHENVEEDNHEMVALPARHINFFSEGEEGIRKTGGNAEYEAEKKAEKEKQEKTIGLLTYLGQSSVELQNEKPWYFKAPEKRKKCEDIQESSSLIKKKEEFDLKHKWGEDPMKKIIQYLDTREKVLERDKGVVSQKTANRVCSDVSEMVTPPLGNLLKLPSLPSANNKKTKHKKKKEHHKMKKHKHEKKKKKRKHSDCSDVSPGKESSMAVMKPSVTSCGKSLQELRAERLRRESEERIKKEQLLAKLHGDAPKEDVQVHDERAQRYNSQFNPELVRKKKTKPNFVETSASK